MRKKLKSLSIVLVLMVVALWAGNTSLFVAGLENHDTRLIAHRGVHQVYAGTDRSIDSCHAAPVETIEHPFVENTLPSIAEAFRLGADVVEIDVHLTSDNVFAVFHDWTLDCRTDGTGVTHKQSFAYLQTLDVAYRIDDATGTYPLRGQGVGLMPSLTDVLGVDWDGQLLINFKSNRAEDGAEFARRLAELRMSDQVFGVYGGAPPTRAAIEMTPGLRGFDRASLKGCLTRYLALGWSGHIPESCRDTFVVVPQNYTGLLWGWPHRFTKRLGAVGTDVVLAGPYDGTGFISSINDIDALSQVPDAFDGYIWTDRIEVIAPRIMAED
ncbi:hypothetical protein L0664_05455 [Octadecabacter sp. G9-8]|uniref:GP-PDE domain-containing protein n=1 Tax=Octadecabacter dasysiphoniae TaxID=2909341 RepID=A0ABS9CU99_9RHOB|nr:glycerophosphodiester phosphodiesterase family protein [Octadecabacter dasysiphoniae]MCF2870506.1 hypothetical protein [Octadecabacter dasysiphoniae]